jgi:tetratricopeptide (TPR) repeat protein
VAGPSAPATPSGGWGRRDWALAAALAVLTLATFCPVLQCDFVDFDDPDYVAANLQVQDGLTARGFAWAWTGVHSANWHPLTWLSLMLDAQLYGLRPWGFHLTNLLLHAANTLLLFAALRRLTAAPWRSAVVAALFAVHPLHVESVAWVSERKDVLSTFFGFAALWAYAAYARTPSLGRYLAVLVLLALSLLAKPMLVTLPLLLLLLDYWPLGRWQSGAARRLVLEKVPLAALSVASACVTVWAQGHGKALSGLEIYPLAGRVANALISYLAYLQQTVLPTDLAVFYPYPYLREPVGVAETAAAALALTGLTAAALYWGRCRPYLPVGWLWYLIALLPVIGLVQVGAQARADRYTYFPLVGVFLLLTWGVADLAGHLRRPALAGVLAAGVLACCAMLSWAQVHVWHDAVSLWADALEHTSHNWRAYTSLGRLLQHQGRQREALAYFQQRLKKEPTDADILTQIALALFDLDRLEESKEYLQRALEHDPEHDLAHYWLVAIYLRRREYAQAIDHLRAYHRLHPPPAQSLDQLAMALLDSGKPAEAVAEWEKAVALQPNEAALHAHLGRAHEALGQWQAAEASYRRAIALRPGDAGSQQGLARVQAKQGRSEEGPERQPPSR